MVEVETDEARAAYLRWSLITEPADPVAHALVDTLGPDAAWQWVCASRTIGGDQWWADATWRQQALDYFPDLSPRSLTSLAKVMSRWFDKIGEIDLTRVAEQARLVQASLVTPIDAAWPKALSDVGMLSPFVLWVRGDYELLRHWGHAWAIVGARACTNYGVNATAELIATGRPKLVVSGGAYGIDAAAHKAALGQGIPTVAVMAGGVDQLYPSGNRELLQQVIAAGVVVSELPFGATPFRSRFLLRNRIIAASATCIVVEAGIRSGALNTARQAARLGRFVAAIPGPVTSPVSAGSHQLIKEGVGVLVTDGQDLRELLHTAPKAGAVESMRNDQAQSLSGDQAPVEAGDQATSGVIETIRASLTRPLEVAEISEATGLEIAQVHAALGEMLLAEIVSAADGKWRLCRNK